MKAWRLLRIVPLAAIVLLAACSSRYSTLDDRSGKQAMLYTLSEDEALKLAHATMVSTFPGRAVTTLNGPTRGYSTSTRFMLDTYSQQVLVLPATGKTAAGETVSGYYFEVSGSGSSGSGRARNQQFAENIRANLDKTGTGVPVSDVQVMPPTASSAPAGSSQRPAPIPTTTSGTTDPLTQIERLKALLDQGAITPQEYEAKKAELMKRL